MEVMDNSKLMEILTERGYNVEDMSQDALTEALATLPMDGFSEEGADCAVDPDVLAAQEIYNEAVIAFGVALGDRQDALDAKDEAKKIADAVKPAGNLLSSAQNVLEEARLKLQAAEEAHTANPIEGVTDEAVSMAIGVRDDAMANVTKYAVELEVAQAQATEADYPGKKAAYDAADNLAQSAYHDQHGYYIEFLQVEAKCEEANCGVPSTQTIQIFRSDTTPTDLAPGELAWSEQIVFDEVTQSDVLTRNLWIGDFGGGVQKLYAFGNKETEGSQAKIIDDFQTILDTEVGRLGSRIDNVLENVDPETIDSFTEAVQVFNQIDLDQEGLAASVQDLAIEGRREIERVREEYRQEIDVLKLRHETELNCLRSNFGTIDGGSSFSE